MDTNQQSSQQKSTLFKRVKITGPVIITVVVALFFVAGTAMGYKYGYSNGKEAGEKTRSGASMLSDIANPFPTISGKVSEISNDKIVVSSSRGTKETVKVTNRTKVTKKKDTLQVSDIKKDQKVTVFTQGDGNDRTASRIIILE